MATRQKLVLPLKVKSVSDEGSFQGMASLFGVLDLQGDVVDAGAFTKTVLENPVVPILWQHQTDEVIGSGTIRNTPSGLAIDGELDMDDPVALKAHGKLCKGLIRGLSIGFETVKDEIKNGIRHLVEVKLWEVSIVTLAALPSAQVTSVKAAEERERARERRVSEQIAEIKELLRGVLRG
jgi:HK97 family phage prohead protease